MTASGIGYDRDLFVLPFDHRSSFEAGLLGIRDRQPEPHEIEQLSTYKRIIYDGLLEALDKGAPIKSAAILVDQTYGEAILRDARDRGIITCVPVEKSGQTEFDFEHGDHFRERIQDAHPTFVKVLVRYNPDGDPQVNENQRKRLKILSDYTHSSGYKFMFELLVPATPCQLEAVGGDKRTYDLSLRPELTVRAMAGLQAANIEPDVWKLEGVEESRASLDVVTQARSGGRNKVGVIVLGRGEDEGRVGTWLKVGAQTEGVIGFAVGQTVFWQPLVDHKDGKIDRTQAVSRIASTYQGLYNLFIQTCADASLSKGETVSGAS